MAKEPVKAEPKKEPKKFFIVKEGLPTGVDWAGRQGFIVSEEQLTPL